MTDNDTDELTGYGPLPEGCKEYCPACGTATERQGPSMYEGDAWTWKCMSCEAFGKKEDGEITARTAGGKPMDPETGDVLPDLDENR